MPRIKIQSEKNKHKQKLLQDNKSNLTGYLAPSQLSVAKIVKKVLDSTLTPKTFFLSQFCALYKKCEMEIKYQKIGKIFEYLQQHKIKIEYDILWSEEEQLSSSAIAKNKSQHSQSRGLAEVMFWIMSHKKITFLEEKVLFWIFFHTHNQEYKELARMKICNGNKKALIYIIQQLYGRPVHDDGDLLMEGVTLMLAQIDKFKPELNNKFVTFAIWGIKQGLQASIFKGSNFIHLPQTLLQKIYKYNKWLEHSNDDKAFQKANKVSNYSMNMIKKYHSSFGSTLSMDKEIINNNRGESTATAFVRAEQTDALQEVSNALQEEQLNLFLQKTLNAIEFQIIKSKFGLSGETEKPLDLIAQELNKDIAEIKSTLQTAMKKLKKSNISEFFPDNN